MTTADLLGSIYYIRRLMFLMHLNILFNMLKTNSLNALKLCAQTWGGDVSKNFQSFLNNKGIISQRTCPYTPQQNGVAEQKNRHLLDVTRTLLIEASVPPRFWTETLTTVVYLINRLPSPTIAHLTPHFKLFGHHPVFDHLHTFGCICFVHLPSQNKQN